MRDKILEVKNLIYSYEEGKKVLKDISVTIYSHEKIAVLGGNGAGKSTFFLNINGVREPCSGEISYRGEMILRKNRKLLRKNIGIVFQDADNQIIASSVKAEVAFGPMNMKISREEVERKTMEVIKEMNLEHLIMRPPHYLSGGEKKRVTIADILAMDTEVIIFDEPTSSLDPVNVHMLEQTLDKIEKLGKTILISTHDVDFAYRFAQRILVFSEGELIADDIPENVFRDEELLKKANLKKPIILEVYELLLEKGIIGLHAGNTLFQGDLKSSDRIRVVDDVRNSDHTRDLDDTRKIDNARKLDDSRDINHNRATDNARNDRYPKNLKELGDLL